MLPVLFQHRWCQRILAAVVADHVEPPLRVQAETEVAVGADDALSVVERSRDYLAVPRLHYRGAAPAEDLLSLRKGNREVIWKG